MNNQMKFINIRNVVVLFLVAGGIGLVSLTASTIAAVPQQQVSAEEPKFQKSDQMRSITGRVLIINDAGETTYYLDIDSDGTEDYRLEFRSESQRSAMPRAGEQVTVRGYLQGITLEVYEVEDH